MKFEWKDEYSLGDINIDAEHQALIELANVIFESPNQAELLKNIMELYRHIRKHFAYEEKVMRDHHYPDYLTQVDEHNSMLSSLVENSDRIRSGSWDQDQIADFMMIWVNHIAESDQCFRKYQQERKRNAFLT